MISRNSEEVGTRISSCMIKSILRIEGRVSHCEKRVCSLTSMYPDEYVPGVVRLTDG